MYQYYIVDKIVMKLKTNNKNTKHQKKASIVCVA